MQTGARAARLDVLPAPWGEFDPHAGNVPGRRIAVAILWLRRPPTEPEVRSKIGSQEPIRIGPPVSLRPLNLDLYDLIQSQFNDRNVGPTGLLDRQTRERLNV
jgi:hypothetical protein